MFSALDKNMTVGMRFSCLQHDLL